MARYIIRFDDICEGTDWNKLNKIIAILDCYKIKAIFGVIPENLDKSIEIQKVERNDFFHNVRNLANSGHIIAQHGYQHLLRENKRKIILSINNYGEFLFDEYNKERDGISKGKELLIQQNIIPQIYMPPAHFITKHTTKIIADLGFKFLTDGLFLFPKKNKKIIQIPQQFWRVRAIYFIPGIFTFCYHPNEINNEQIEKIHNFIIANHNKFINPLSVKYFPFLAPFNYCSKLLFYVFFKIKTIL